MRKQKFAKRSFCLNPGWCLVWGNVDTRLGEYAFSIPGLLGVVDAQPSFSSDKKILVMGDVWLTNRDELLRNLGVDLRGWTGTDEEVVAFAWERWGVESVKELMGIFGLVIWEQESNSLWLIRDRVGGKTLYYSQVGSRYYVAPRLKNLASYHSKQLNLVALRDYLCMAFVPGERTLWEDVKELRPGTLLSLPAGRVETYWEPVEQIVEENKPLEWHGRKLRSLLEQVIQEYLPESNPVGVYLSGGLDSSSVTAF